MTYSNRKLTSCHNIYKQNLFLKCKLTIQNCWSVSTSNSWTCTSTISTLSTSIWCHDLRGLPGIRAVCQSKPRASQGVKISNPLKRGILKISHPLPYWWCFRNLAFTSWYGRFSHYLQGFIHGGWCRIPTTVCFISGRNSGSNGNNHMLRSCKTMHCSRNVWYYLARPMDPDTNV